MVALGNSPTLPALIETHVPEDDVIDVPVTKTVICAKALQNAACQNVIVRLESFFSLSGCASAASKANTEKASKGPKSLGETPGP